MVDGSSWPKSLKTGPTNLGTGSPFPLSILRISQKMPVCIRTLVKPFPTEDLLWPLLGLLPASFRLSCDDYHFEFAAACLQVGKQAWVYPMTIISLCLQEKTLWMNQIRVARTRCTLRNRELPSSLEVAASKPPTPPQSSTPSSRKATSPTPISPVSDNVLTNPPKRRSSLGVLDTDLMHLLNPALAFMVSTTPTTPEVPTNSISVEIPPTISTPVQLKNLLEGEASTILIRRASENYRRIVDQSLHDVFFEECQAVRLQAQMKTSLFLPPKLTSKTGSISARNKMTRRESVLLMRQRSVAEPSSSTSKASSASKFALSRNKSTGVAGSKELRRRTLMLPSFSFLEEREEGKTSRRPHTAHITPFTSMPSSLPVTPTEADQPQSLDGPIMFQPRRNKAKRASRFGSQVSEPMENGDRETDATKTAAPNTLKELPPVPSSSRMSSFFLPTSRSTEDRNRFPLTPRMRPADQRPSTGNSTATVFSVGQGISNVDPGENSGGGGGSSSISKLHPGALIRRSLGFIGSKRIRNHGGYVGSLFNRSTASVVPDGDGGSSIVRKGHSEPPPSPPKRLSASTPALQEPLEAWEILPSAATIGHFDSKRPTSVPGIPPLPPLPRHAHTLRPSKSLSHRGSSLKAFQRLNPLMFLSNRDS